LPPTAEFRGLSAQDPTNEIYMPLLNLSTFTLAFCSQIGFSAFSLDKAFFNW